MSPSRKPAFRDPFFQNKLSSARSHSLSFLCSNPFGFSLTPIQAGGDVSASVSSHRLLASNLSHFFQFIINYNGQAGVLAVPSQNVVRSGTSTGQPVRIFA